MMLSVSNIAWTPEERLAAYDVMIDAGVKGLEIAPSLFFAGAPDSFRPDAITFGRALGEVADRGLELVSMQSLLFGVEGAALIGTPGARAAFDLAMKRAIDLAARCAIPNLVFGSPRQRAIPEGMPADEALAAAVDSFRGLGDYAAACGSVIAIEPNPTVYGTNFLTTLAEADRFVRQVDHPAIMLNLDLGTAHVNGDFRDLPDQIGALALRVAHVHVSEPHLAPAPADGTELGPVLRALVDAGYARAVSIEMKRPEGGVNEVRLRIGRLTAAAAAAGDGT